jgi:hypothetical protein
MPDYLEFTGSVASCQWFNRTDRHVQLSGSRCATGAQPRLAPDGRRNAALAHILVDAGPANTFRSDDGAIAAGFC